MNRFLNRYFNFDKYGTNTKTETIAGITTFVTMAYILILNPIILSDPFFIMEQGDYAEKIKNGVFIGTCIGAFIGTLLVGLYAKLPFAQAPGMGLNAFFAYTCVLTLGYSYGEALVIVFISGLLFIVITAVGLREAIVRAIPKSVAVAMTPAIGLFITIIGLKNGGIIVANDATFVAMVDFAAWTKPDADISVMMGAIVALIGLVTICVLHMHKFKAAILTGMVVATIVGIPLGVTQFGGFSLNIGQQMSEFMEISLFQMDFAGIFTKGESLASSIFTVTMLVISFSLVNMFDSIGTLQGATKQAGMLDENGEVPNMKKAMMSDAVSTVAGAMVGTSTVTTFVESSAGIAAGGRTGFTSVVTAFLFLGAIILAPIISIIPSAATAPALIFVGILMLSNIKEVDFGEMTDALPAFCTIVFMPFTYSIANGIAMGIIMHCLMKLFTGKAKEIRLLTVVIAVIFALRYAFMSM